MAIRYVCKTCQSEDVVLTSYAVFWSVPLQAWVAEEPFDRVYCNRCNDDTTATPKELESCSTIASR